jgi:pilus assembly protein Flp/PilA
MASFLSKLGPLFYDLLVVWFQTMKKTIIRFFADESGFTTVEYAVAGALISIALIGAFITLGGSVAGMINSLDAVLPG